MDIKVENSPLVFNHIGVPIQESSLGRTADLSAAYIISKRSFDVFLSLLLITGVLSWLLPILALLIKFDSRGSVFFLQKRLGKGGHVFTCLKLRTMTKNQQADWLPAAEHDIRITAFGRILRRTHLDELPQLFNVFFGSMSLVGPRPYMLADCATFVRMLSGHPVRELVKPGITGLAQVNGLHGPGPVTDFQTIFGRYQWDAFYVRNASFALDIRILRQTLALFFTQPASL